MWAASGESGCLSVFDGWAFFKQFLTKQPVIPAKFVLVFTRTGNGRRNLYLCKKIIRSAKLTVWQPQADTFAKL
jgi:hypothetical protein